MPTAQTLVLRLSLLFEVPRVLFLGICLDFYYFLRRVLLPKFGALRNLDVRVGTMDLAVATLTPGSFS